MVSPWHRQTLYTAGILALLLSLAALAIRCSDTGDDSAFHVPASAAPAATVK